MVEQQDRAPGRDRRGREAEREPHEMTERVQQGRQRVDLQPFRRSSSNRDRNATHDDELAPGRHVADLAEQQPGSGGGGGHQDDIGHPA